jgi:hypothetical protein
MSSSVTGPAEQLGTGSSVMHFISFIIRFDDILAEVLFFLILVC